MVGGPLAPGAVRDFLTHGLDSAFGLAGTDVTYDVRLVASELVTNAVEAGSSFVQVCLHLHREWLTIEVQDEMGGVPEVGPRTADRTSGRGLQIVSALAEVWGAERSDIGKVVWAQLPVPHALTGGLECAMSRRR